MQTELDTMTTRQLNRLRRRIKHVYETAKAEMQGQLTEFIEHFKELDEYKRTQLENGNISDEDYRTWLRNQVFQSEQMKAKLDNITDICTKTQSTAYKMARHEQYTTFANGANFAYYNLEKQAGASLNLTIYNTAAVQRLLTEQPRILPNKQIKSASNKIYDAKVFNRYVTQGIIQGKNVTEIATQAVNGMADTEMHWAENNAITALTSAQNAGTLQQLKEAKAMGLDVKKQWNATLDYHTRETHRLLDQQTAELEEPFKVLGYQIDYPADPHAAPEMVYRCRCRLTGVLGKYKPKNAQRRDNVTKEVVQEQSYQEWYSSKQNSYNDLTAKVQPVTMQSISNVKSFNCDTLSATGQKRLQTAHKHLLMAASKQPLGVEVGRVFDLNMNPLTDTVVGSAEGYTVALPKFDTPYVVIHTHPTSDVFSDGDLLNFAKNENLKLMTAIGHDGHIYAVEKGSDYDFSAANGIIWQMNAEISKLKNTPKAELSDEQLLKLAEELIWRIINELKENGAKFYE